MTLITLFTFSLGLMVTGFKKKQIKYIDDLIYIGERILMMLDSTSPETQEIMRELKCDYRLKNFDFTLKNENSPLPPEENDRSRLLFNTVGKYDIDCQINYIKQYLGYFKMLRQRYQDYYLSHRRLYPVAGLFCGVLISVLLA